MTATASNQQVLREMHGLLRGATTPEAASQNLTAEASRLGLYQTFVEAHIRGVLKKNYVTLASMLGEAAFPGLARGFFEAYPADDWELNACVRQFPEYLREVGASQLHVEIAELEWQEVAVYLDPVEIPLPQSITEPVINPTLQVMRFDFSVSQFIDDWRAWENGDLDNQPSEPTPGEGEVVFVFRHPETATHNFQRADDSALFAFKVAQDQVPLEKASELSGLAVDDVAQVMKAASRRGFVILPSGVRP